MGRALWAKLHPYTPNIHRCLRYLDFNRLSVFVSPRGKCPTFLYHEHISRRFYTNHSETTVALNLGRNLGILDGGKTVCAWFPLPDEETHSCVGNWILSVVVHD